MVRKEQLNKVLKNEEIMRLKIEEDKQRNRDKRIRQAIIQNSSELRDLERNLQNAFMNKERAFQREVKLLKNQIERVIKAHENDKLLIYLIRRMKYKGEKS
jgi:hypothetical protein